ncbi:MAG: hypothetical protein JXA77_16820 [Bacteroidales bacterium]|nr:hypothetical protein [Bacteroidales bacterium]MBN2819364.1 hypothetical protein [Bacteroidales bacterium]
MKLDSKYNSNLFYNEENKYLCLGFNHNPDSELLKSISLELLTYLEIKQVNKLLVNTANVTNVKLNDIMWITEKISPNIKQYHIDKIAFINPRNSIGKISLKIMIKLSSCINTKAFDDPENAELWLFSNLHTISA